MSGAAGPVLGVDIGGTFTDVVLGTADGQLHTGKYPTTAADPTRAVVDGTADLLARTGVAPGAVTRAVHATTLATNVILERRGAPVAFVTTRGFRDMLALGRQARVEADRYDLFFAAAEPLVPLTHCFEVPERIGAGGHVLTPFDESAASDVVARIAELAVPSVAICFLHSYANRAHEARMAALCRAGLPDVSVVAASEIWPEVREYERASTAVVSAYVGPVMARYLSALESRLRELGVRAPVHVMESGGGVMSAALAARRAVHTVESGPAAGVIAARRVGAQCGRSDVISFDMGGTTAKAGVIRGGRVDVTREFHVGGKGSFGGRRAGTGVPIKVPAVDLAEVGSGGGSIAWIDGGGALQVGPQSAGSDPGPACYGLGGTRPTVTDADLVLGFLDPARFAGGSIGLRADLATDAVSREISGRLGVGSAAAAQAVHDIANANMGAAVQVVTVQRGIDPRRFALVASGGAGPMHAARIAERFDITTVAVPYRCGVGSAVGLLVTDLTTERARTVTALRGHEDREDRENIAALAQVFDELVEAALADLGDGPTDARVTREVDLRFRGQAHEVTVPAPSGPLTRASLDAVNAAFRQRYGEMYGSDLPGPTELVTLRVRVNQPVPTLDLDAVRGPDPRSDPRTGTRRVFLPEHGDYVEVPVLDRETCPVGYTIEGPTLVEESESTTVVPPGWRMRVDEGRVLLLTR